MSAVQSGQQCVAIQPLVWSDVGSACSAPPEFGLELVVWHEGVGLTLGNGSRPLDQLNDEMGRGDTVRGIAVQSAEGQAMRQCIPSQVAGAADWPMLQRYAEQGMHHYLAQRGIHNLWVRQPLLDVPQQSAVYYKFANAERNAPNWCRCKITQAFAGTYWQLIMAISHGGGRLRPSGAGDGGCVDTDRFCCSPQWNRAACFAWATNVFGDGIMHGLMLDIAVNTSSLNSTNQWGGPGWLHDFYMHADDVWLQGMWMIVDKHVGKNVPRFDRWRPELDVVGMYRHRV